MTNSPLNSGAIYIACLVTAIALLSWAIATNPSPPPQPAPSGVTR